SSLLHLLPFTHNYLIGILHVLIWLSYFITPSLIYLLLKRIDLPPYVLIPVSLAVSFLSPQFYRLYAGHYALAYNCLIPLLFLLLFRYWENKSYYRLSLIFLFNFALFFIHPYYGLGFSLFSLSALFAYGLFDRSIFLKELLSSLITGILPVLLFQVIMHFSDEHPDRTTEPFGNAEFISNRASFFVPFFGPFKKFLESLVQSEPAHFEGYCYLGLATLALAVPCISALPFLYRKNLVHKGLLSIFLSSLVFLFLSVGLHLQVLDLLHLKIPALNQFRAMGRFSWFLYFSLPMLLFALLYKGLESRLKPKLLRGIMILLSFTFLASHAVEARYYFTMYGDAYWHDRNFFNPALLNNQEKSIIRNMQHKSVQAILPLPTFFLGSEVYDRSTCAFPLIVSTLYSYHTGVPILSSYSSRSSISETKAGINLLNCYNKDNPYWKFLNDRPLLVFKTNESLLPDEERMASKLKFQARNDSVQFGFFSKRELLQPVLDQNIFTLNGDSISKLDSIGLICIPNKKGSPYTKANFMNYEMAYVLDSNKIPSGQYVVSIHFYPSGLTFHEMGAGFIITKQKGKEYIWQDMLPFKLQSAFYEQFGVLERYVELERHARYEFMIKGGENIEYRVSHFLLRPVGTSVRLIQKTDTLLNNFPVHSNFAKQDN
ncbi:MAG TPA: hypothetical protein PLQ93_09235, partial [Bacteroidia bacterium]|nr:hypothetical protein [Bacteroidia bacterium]